MTIRSAINFLRPGASWTMRGETYAGLEWQDEAQSKPIEAEVSETMLLPEPVPVPQEVARWALRELCEERGHEVEIETAFSKLPVDVQRKARGRWASKDTISRGSSIISALQSILKWTNAYVDELFSEADKLSKS